MALTKVSGEVIKRPLILTGDASISGIMTVGTGSTSTTINGAHEYPSIRPTLDLNFAATKTLDRRITFTRDSIGTYTDELGIVRTAPNNTPRFDHDPTTGESLGLLIEESRTNKLPYSVDFSNAQWTKINGGTGSAPTVTTNYAISPDGTTTASRIQAELGVGTNPGDYTLVRENILTDGTDHTWSVWLKSNTGADQKVLLSWYNPSDFNISPEPVTVTSTWQRFSSTKQQASFEADIGMRGDATDITRSVDILAWGGQLEDASFPTSYIPTSGSTVTRAVDTAVIKGTNFSSWYNASESTIFFESGIAPTNNSKYFTFYGSDGGGTELIESAAVSGPGANIFTYADSTVYSNIPVTDASATKLKFAAGIKLNDVNLAVNGILGTTDTSATNPDAINQLIIGNYISGNYYLNTTIKKLSYYNKRLPNAQLQGLTAQ